MGSRRTTKRRPWTRPSRRQRIVSWEQERELEGNDSELVSQLTVPVPEDLYDRVTGEAKSRGTTVRSVLEEILDGIDNISLEDLLTKVFQEIDAEKGAAGSNTECRYLSSRLDAERWSRVKKMAMLVASVRTHSIVKLLVRKHFGLLQLEEQADEQPATTNPISG